MEQGIKGTNNDGRFREIDNPLMKVEKCSSHY
jgi:hypothetical protein